MKEFEVGKRINAWVVVEVKYKQRGGGSLRDGWQTTPWEQQWVALECRREGHRVEGWSDDDAIEKAGKFKCQACVKDEQERAAGRPEGRVRVNIGRPHDMENARMIQLYVPEDLRVAAMVRARSEGKSMSAWIRDAMVKDLMT